jgi:prepilin-type N-terminal cleavage/methylation domain-containing protein
MVRTCPRRGFTLVELLIVIAIIAMLVGLLLPAVQSARESARRTQCGNNIKQLALGAQQHVQSQGFFPSGGWGYAWTGDADRGFGAKQPGGWAYSTLPFIEQTAVHQLGAGATAAAKMTANSTRCSTPVPLFYCASRRQAVAYPWGSSSQSPTNANRPSTYAKTDFAFNGGGFTGSPPAGPAINCLDLYPNCYPNVDNWYGNTSSNLGMTSHRSETTPAGVPDGLSNTLLLAEKYLNPTAYTSGSDPADNMDPWEGWDWDNVRWTTDAPMPDTPGVQYTQQFGSAHALAFMTAACDGSVRAVAYTISPSVWESLGHRRDGVVVNWK